MPQMPDPGPEPQPELCFCMVRAIGTDLAPIENGLTRKLLEAKFVPKKIKLSDEIAKQTLVQDLVKGITNQYRRYDALMTAGDVLRSCTGRPEAAAVLAMEAIQAERPHLRKVAEERGNRGVAFILSSLMGRAEVRSLRDVYGPRLFVISAYSHTDSRRNRLRDSLTASAVEMNQDVDELVEELMARDRGRSYDESALLSRVIDVAEHRILSIDKTFDLGDFFVDADAPPARIEEDVERLLALILSSPKHTPTKPEMGMAHAYSARLRSSSLSRQVGAAICDDDGNLLVTGTNEVPKAGGGQYWIDDPEPPKRDIEIGHDTSDRTRREIFGDLVERLVADPSWLINAIQETMNDGERPDVEQGSKTIEEDARIAEQLRSLMARVDLDLAIDSALSARSVRGAQLFDVVEYGRDLSRCAARRVDPERHALLHHLPVPHLRVAHRRRRDTAGGLHRAVPQEQSPRDVPGLDRPGASGEGGRRPSRVRPLHGCLTAEARRSVLLGGQEGRRSGPEDREGPDRRNQGLESGDRQCPPHSPHGKG
jgi:deoxycytidylate deaminase